MHAAPLTHGSGHKSAGGMVSVRRGCSVARLSSPSSTASAEGKAPPTRACPVRMEVPTTIRRMGTNRWLSGDESPSGRHRRAAGVAVAVALVLTACGGGGDDKKGEAATTDSTAAAPDQVQAQVASYDLAVGPPARFIVGIYNEARGPVGFGTVPLRFFFLGADNPNGTPQPGPTASGTYLPLPGSAPPPAEASKPSYLPTDQRGVYAAPVSFDRPGFWGVEATVDLEPEPQSVRLGFKVAPKHTVPFPGDPAPQSQNLTVATPGAIPGAIDSRASSLDAIPDAELHQSTVAQALAEKRPVLLVVSTPTYCESRFCGPVTDVVQGLAKDYADRARFVHIEVWKDYRAQAVNAAAAEWIARGEGFNEPWVFLVGADGKVAARFDNVATEAEIEPLLQALPPRPA